MDWKAVKQRIEAGEDQHTEFKLGLGDLSALGKTICAFANSNGGVLILGVDDQRRIRGVREPARKVQERLTSFLHTGCSQPVTAWIGSREDEGKHVFWIEVPAQRGFEPLRCLGRTWIRRGSGSVEPSSAELQELFNTFGFVLTEERAIQGAPPSHIDYEAFLAYLDRLDFDTSAEPQPSSEDDLRNRGVLVELGGEPRATLYGLMAFGKHPQRYTQTRGFCIECVAYAGEDRASEVLQAASAKGRLVEQVDRSIGWFLGLGRFESYERLVREDRYLLPRDAIREALVNAVIHRDYAIIGSTILLEVFSDRVDITSPGSLPNHLTVEQVMAGANPRARNDSMGHYMASMGYMEKRGRGWLIMQREMRKFNGTEPELAQNLENPFVRVTFQLGAGGE